MKAIIKIKTIMIMNKKNLIIKMIVIKKVKIKKIANLSRMIMKIKGLYLQKIAIQLKIRI